MDSTRYLSQLCLDLWPVAPGAFQDQSGRGEHPAAAVRIRVSHPALVDDLVRFLERMGFAAVECDYAAICVELGEERTAPEFQAQLELYVQVWQATRPGVAAALESEDAGGA
jgi:hypothetical protein